MQAPHPINEARIPILMVLFDFDDTIAQSAVVNERTGQLESKKKGTLGRTRHLKPLSNDQVLRNEKITRDIYDPAAFVNFVQYLTNCGVAVAIVSFGNAAPIRWYLESLFNPRAATLEGAHHPFENTVVARGDHKYNQVLLDASRTPVADRTQRTAYGKVLMADAVIGDRSRGNVLFFDDSLANVNALNTNGYNAVHVPTETGLNREIIEESFKYFRFGDCDE